MKLSAISKRMIIAIGITSLVFIAAGAVYYFAFNYTISTYNIYTNKFDEPYGPWYGLLRFALGVILVAALNAVKVIMLERAVENAVGKDGGRAGSYIQLQHLLRYFLTGAIFIAAVFVPFISLWGAAAGLFTLHIAAYSMKFFINKDEIVIKDSVNNAESPETEQEENSSPPVNQ